MHKHSESRAADRVDLPFKAHKGNRKMTRHYSLSGPFATTTSQAIIRYWASIRHPRRRARRITRSNDGTPRVGHQRLAGDIRITVNVESVVA